MSSNDAREWSARAADPDHHVPFHALLGLTPLQVKNGVATISLSVTSSHLRAGTIAHGGVCATLLDSALGLAAASLAPVGNDLVTIQLNLNFLRPARVGDTLVARGEVLHLGRRTALARGEVRTSDHQLVASGSATLMYLPSASSTSPHEDPPPR